MNRDYIENLEQELSEREQLYLGLSLLTRAATHIAQDFAKNHSRLGKSTSTTYEILDASEEFGLAISTIYRLQTSLLEKLTSNSSS